MVFVKVAFPEMVLPRGAGGAPKTDVPTPDCTELSDRVTFTNDALPRLEIAPPEAPPPTDPAPPLALFSAKVQFTKLNSPSLSMPPPEPTPPISGGQKPVSTPDPPFA